jgi:hypothetical protein
MISRGRREEGDSGSGIWRWPVLISVRILVAFAVGALKAAIVAMVLASLP